MSDNETRLEALRMAFDSRYAGELSVDIIGRAQEYYSFIMDLPQKSKLEVIK